jgi:hypothetical protein
LCNHPGFVQADQRGVEPRPGTNVKPGSHSYESTNGRSIPDAAGSDPRQEKKKNNETIY